ncbi:MAG: hypothetical protein EPO21_08965 [Chloroflexota bacterium]|nr:MAG: hypothetical protein EPO21_08965 [Chloroflexota bacterium]
MTRCSEMSTKLSAYVDGELSERERERVRRHVVGCAVCAEELHELEETAALLGQLSEADPPDTLEPGLRRRIRRRAAGFLVLVALGLVALLPVLTMLNLVLRADLPLWARVGYATSMACFTGGLGLLVLHLLRNVRSLLLYGYLSGGGR